MKEISNTTMPGNPLSRFIKKNGERQSDSLKNSSFGKELRSKYENKNKFEVLSNGYNICVNKGCQSTIKKYSPKKDQCIFSNNLFQSNSEKENFYNFLKQNDMLPTVQTPQVILHAKKFDALNAVALKDVNIFLREYNDNQFIYTVPRNEMNTFLKMFSGHCSSYDKIYVDEKNYENLCIKMIRESNKTFGSISSDPEIININNNKIAIYPNQEKYMIRDPQAYITINNHDIFSCKIKGDVYVDGKEVIDKMPIKLDLDHVKKIIAKNDLIFFIDKDKITLCNNFLSYPEAQRDFFDLGKRNIQLKEISFHEDIVCADISHSDNPYIFTVTEQGKIKVIKIYNEKLNKESDTKIVDIENKKIKGGVSQKKFTNIAGIVGLIDDKALVVHKNGRINYVSLNDDKVSVEEIEPQEVEIKKLIPDIHKSKRMALKTNNILSKNNGVSEQISKVSNAYITSWNKEMFIFSTLDKGNNIRFYCFNPEEKSLNFAKICRISKEIEDDNEEIKKSPLTKSMKEKKNDCYDVNSGYLEIFGLKNDEKIINIEMNNMCIKLISLSEGNIHTRYIELKR